MAQIKFRVELNKGKRGIPLSKLASFSNGFQSFLSSLAGDVSLDTDPDKWVASNFKDGCVAYDIQYDDEVSDEKGGECESKIKIVVSGNSNAIQNSGLKPETIQKFAGVVAPTQPGEVVRIGVYGKNRKRKKWFEVTKEKVKNIPTFPVDAEVIEYYGGVQGEIVSWFLKPSRPSEKPWFWLRDSSADTTIKCLYPPDLHLQVSKLTETYDGIIHVYGQIMASVDEDKIEQIEVDKLEKAETFSNEDFEKFFGCAPNLTKGLTAAEYVRGLRGNGKQIET